MAAQLLETCWWVPVAFGGAGVVLGAAHPLLDEKWGGGPRPPPGWPAVLLNIACFVLCYELSGILAQAQAARGRTTISRSICRYLSTRPLSSSSLRGAKAAFS